MSTDGGALDAVEDGRVAAATQLIGRTGADGFEIRVVEPDPGEEGPIVWVASAHWPERSDEAGQLLMPDHWDACGGMTPWRAVLRLCEACIDGGTCRHCGRPTGVDDQPADELSVETEPFMCWYRYDPELKTFRRHCEGVAP
jgi:hypothetical protein